MAPVRVVVPVTPAVHPTTVRACQQDILDRFVLITDKRHACHLPQWHHAPPKDTRIQSCLLASLFIISRRGPHIRVKIEMRKAVDGARLCQIGLGYADHVGVGVGVVTRAYARVDGQVGEQKNT